MNNENLIILFKRGDRCPGCKPARLALESIFKNIHVVDVGSATHELFKYAKQGYMVRSTPTVRFIKNGRVKNEIVGYPGVSAATMYKAEAIKTFGGNYGGLK